MSALVERLLVVACVVGLGAQIACFPTRGDIPECLIDVDCDEGLVCMERVCHAEIDLVIEGAGIVVIQKVGASNNETQVQTSTRSLFPKGTSLKLRPKRAGGEFLGWVGQCDTVDETDQSCSFVLTVPKRIQAQFGAEDGLIADLPLEGGLAINNTSPDDSIEAVGVVPAEDRDGVADGALEFDGNAYLEIRSRPALDGMDQLTSCGYVFTSTGGTVLSKGSQTTAYALDIVPGEGEVTLFASLWIDGRVRLASNAQKTLLADRWYHVCAVYDGATWATYVDGDEIATVAASGRVDTVAGASEDRRLRGRWSSRVRGLTCRAPR